MTDPTPNPALKQALIEAIEAYAAAKPTANVWLQETSARHLSDIIDKIDVTAIVTEQPA